MGFPRWTRDDAVQRGLECFANGLLEHGLVRDTAVLYASHVAKGWGDPVAYLRSLRSWQGFRHARSALIRYANMRGQTRAVAVLSSIEGPMKPPARVFKVPDLAGWARLGPELVRANPGPMGDLLWIVVYSGLRIGDLLGITRAQAAELVHGEEVVRQKGRGGRRTRLWRPAREILPAIAKLTRVPGWTILADLVSSAGVHGAAELVRQRIPHPWTPHTFRQCFATYFYQLTRDLVAVRDMGGWESTATVERYIIHLPKEVTDNYRRRMGALLFPHGTPYDRKPGKPTR